MKRKKELTYLALLLAAIPVIFFGLAMLNYFVIKDFEQGNGFFISGIIFGIIGILIFWYECKNSLKSSKNSGELSFYMMPIVSILEEDSILNITVSCMLDNQKYSFCSSYETKDDHVVDLLNQKVNELNVKDMKVFVDLKKIEKFEFDIDDFLKRLELDVSLDLLFTSFHK